jgi:hypothetical protein
MRYQFYLSVLLWARVQGLGCSDLNPEQHKLFWVGESPHTLLEIFGLAGLGMDLMVLFFFSFFPA